jgi:hypothetical protein
MISAYRHITPTNSFDEPSKEKLDLDNAGLRRWDHGIHAGIGIGLHIQKSLLFLESGYYHGFTDVDPLNASQNRSIELGAGFKITL